MISHTPPGWLNTDSRWTDRVEEKQVDPPKRPTFWVTDLCHLLCLNQYVHFRRQNSGVRNRLPSSCLLILTKVAGFVEHKENKKSLKLFASQELGVRDGFPLLHFVDQSGPLGEDRRRGIIWMFLPRIEISRVITVTAQKRAP